MLFFLDRNTLANLKTTLGSELGITNPQYSMLVTAFMAPYIAMYFVVGWIIDRIGTRKGVAIFVLLMSLATLICGLANNVWQMAGARMLLGIAEAGIMPATFVALTRWFPPHRRAFVVSVRAPIQNFGTVISPVFAAFIALHIGWRFAFWIPGAIGIVVAIVWWFVETKPTAAESAAAPTSLFSVMLCRAFWGIFAIRILIDPFWFLLQFWQAGYMQEAMGLSLKGVGMWLWIPPTCEAILGLFLGWYSDSLIRKGKSPVRARSMILIGLLALFPCVYVLAFSKSVSLSIVMLVTTMFMSHAWMGGVTLLAAEIAPKGTMASVIGVMSALGGVSSLAVQAVAGHVVDWLGYSALFMASGSVFPIAAFIVWRCYLRKSPEELAASALQSIGQRHA